MAVVFQEAEHIEISRDTVAVKVLPLTSGQDERLQSRFSAEMRIVARLRHPNIVGALDAGRVMSDGSEATVLWYLVMEYVPGVDLEVYVNKHGPLSTIRACNLIYQAAAALEEINKYQLVHRDIKPSNIMVTPEDQAKVLDFGLSRQIDTRVTQPGTLLGTLDYMAPEQARDASSVDIRADIYSLGVTLFWCLTGRVPYSGSVLKGDLFQRFQLPPPSVLRYAPEVPVEMDAFLKKIMAAQTGGSLCHAAGGDAGCSLPFLKPDAYESVRPVVGGRPPSRLPGCAAGRAEGAGLGPSHSGCRRRVGHSPVLQSGADRRWTAMRPGAGGRHCPGGMVSQRMPTIWC